MKKYKGEQRKVCRKQTSETNKQMKKCQNQRGKLMMMMWGTSVISVWSSVSRSDPYTESKASLGYPRFCLNNNKKELEEKDLGDGTMRH